MTTVFMTSGTKHGLRFQLKAHCFLHHTGFDRKLFFRQNAPVVSVTVCHWPTNGAGAVAYGAAVQIRQAGGRLRLEIHEFPLFRYVCVGIKK